MALTVDELRQAALLIEQALELPEEERQSWIAGRGDVSSQVREHLIAALARAEDDRLPTLAGLGGNDLDEDETRAGDEVGGYRLLRRIGRGGMGEVWLAERSDGLLRRQVALKLPHSSLSRRQLAERFAREREILSALEHPNIARLYDAGISSDGRPYMALEYVQGQTLLEYCQANGLDLNRRLDLFLQILAAVAHAHVHLVVHRDLKPGNVLVSADGRVHLLDFGIAKLLVDGSTPASEQTQFGGRAMTPRYAAPEQVLGRPAATTTDIYSLGVMLYELVAGRLPYALMRDTQSDLEQAILDAEPVVPSAAAKRVIPWAGSLKGDLDTIVLKTLRKDPAQRYATAGALAEDICRYLDGQPVLASADSRWYRLGKFVIRHRVFVSAVTLAVLGLAAGLGIALWQATVAREQAELAREEARTARAVEDFLTGIFQANSVVHPDPAMARRTTARELLDLGAGRLVGSLEDAPKAKARMLRLMTELYANIGLDDTAADLATALIALCRTTYGADSEELADALLAAYSVTYDPPDGPSRLGPLLEEAQGILDRRGDQSSNRYGQLQMWLAWYWTNLDFARARDHADRAVARLRGTAYAAAAFKSAADLALKAGDYAAARDLADEGLKAAAEGREEQPGLHQIAGEAREALGDAAAAERELRLAWEAGRQIFGERDTVTLVMAARLAELLCSSGRRDTCLNMIGDINSALAQRPPGEAGAALRAVRYALGRAQSAAGLWREAVANLAVVSMSRPYEASPVLAERLRAQARALLGAGRRDDARAILDRAVNIRERAGVRPARALAEEADIGAGQVCPPIVRAMPPH